MSWANIALAATAIITTKYQSNIANDPKAAIGSGTAPAMQTGPPIEVTPVQGTTVEDFGDFEAENMAEPENMPEEEKVLMMLQESGVNLEGLASLAYGGPVQYKGNGGSIFDLFPELGIDFKRYADASNITTDPVDGIIAPPAPEFTFRDDLVIDKTPSGMHEAFVDSQKNWFEQLNMYAEENPEMFGAGVGALTKVMAALITDEPKSRGSIVSTQTLPGNSNRRRSNLENITPIGGSKVTFANKGTALNRPMFMPHGGKMRGPGGPKDDLIPVMASNGEFMLSKAAVDAAGGGNHAQGIARLEAFNKLGNQRYG